MDSRLINGMGQVENISPCKLIHRITFDIAVALHPVPVAEDIGPFLTQFFLQILPGPEIECTFTMLSRSIWIIAVCILGRIKPACRVTHIPEEISESISRYLRIPTLICDLKCIEIGIDKLGLIIKHLFKVRDKPAFIDGITMKSAANLIIHATLGHLFEGKECHVTTIFLSSGEVSGKKKIKDHRSRKLGCLAETAFPLVVTLSQQLIAVYKYIRLDSPD